MRPRRVWLEVAVPIAVIVVLIALLAPVVQQARNSARLSQSMNNLKQLGLAFASYHDVYDRFPPGAIVDVEGNGYRGWTTSILPYLDASPVYNGIDMNVPWDAPENEFSYRASYPVYRSPLVKDEVTTEGYPLLHYEANPNLFYRNSSVSLSHDHADAGATWVLGSATGNYLPWGYPFHWRPLGDRVNAGPNSFGDPWMMSVPFLFADGTVRLISHDVDSGVLRKMGTIRSSPMPMDIAVPPPPATFRWTGRVRQSIPIGVGHWITVMTSKERTNPTITMGYSGKDDLPEPLTPAQIEHTIVDRIPSAVSLSVEIKVDKPMAEVIAKLKELEELKVNQLYPTEAVIQSLKSLPKLKHLGCWAEDPQASEVISRAFPDLKLDVRVLTGSDSEE